MDVKILEKISGNHKIIKGGEFDQLSLMTLDSDDNDKLLLYIENADYIDSFIDKKGVSAVICTDEIAKKIKDVFDGAVCVSETPKATFFLLHNYMAENIDPSSENTLIAPSASIDPNAIIDPKGVIIGEECVIGAGAVVNSGTTIGDNVFIDQGVIVGCHAFYSYEYLGEKKAVISRGGVTIEDNVVILANCVIAKGVFLQDTFIGKNTKLDSSIHVAHDVRLEENCTVAGNSTFGGFVHVLSGAYLGLNVTVVPMVTIGKNTLLSAGSVISRDVKEGKHVSGNFAVDHDKYIDFIKSISK